MTSTRAFFGEKKKLVALYRTFRSIFRADRVARAKLEIKSTGTRDSIKDAGVAFSLIPNAASNLPRESDASINQPYSGCFFDFSLYSRLDYEAAREVCITFFRFVIDNLATIESRRIYEDYLRDWIPRFGKRNSIAAGE